MVMWKIFGPQPVPNNLGGLPKEMALCPSQIRASAAVAVMMMVPGAFMMRGHDADLKRPVVIEAGEQDRLIDVEAQSVRCIHLAPQELPRIH